MEIFLTFQCGICAGENYPTILGGLWSAAPPAIGKPRKENILRLAAGPSQRVRHAVDQVRDAFEIFFDNTVLDWEMLHLWARTG